MSEASIDFDQLTKKCFDNQELVNTLVQRFHDSLAGYEDNFSEVDKSQNLEAIELLAHRLAGESGTMCAWEIHETAKQLCEACRRSAIDELDELLAQLSSDFTKLREFTIHGQQKHLQTT